MSEEKKPEKEETKGELIKRTLWKKKAFLKTILPASMSVERFVGITQMAIERNYQLAGCTLRSLMLAVAQAAELGLEIGGPLGHAALVPYRSKGGSFEAQLQPMYRGLIELALRPGTLSTIEARIVREKDDFSYSYGLTPTLRHSLPLSPKDRGAITHAYAVAHLKDGSSQFEVMPIEDIYKIRNGSKAYRHWLSIKDTPAGTKADPPIWVAYEEAMCKKTVTKQLLKFLGSSPAVAIAMEQDNRVEAGEPSAPLTPTEAAIEAEFLSEEPPLGAEAGGETPDTEEVAASPMPRRKSDKPPTMPQETRSSANQPETRPSPSSPADSPILPQSPTFFERWLACAAAIKGHLKKSQYYEALGTIGFEHANQVTDKISQAELLRTWAASLTKDQKKAVLILHGEVLRVLRVLT